MPDGGWRELYDSTLGYQAAAPDAVQRSGVRSTASSGCTPWSRSRPWRSPSLVAFVPRRRDTIQVAALGAAVLIALELTASYWFYLYIVWFAPLVLVAILARTPVPGPPPQTAAASGGEVREPVAA